MTEYVTRAEAAQILSVSLPTLDGMIEKHLLARRCPMGEPMTYFVAAVPARTADAAMRAVGQFEGIVRLAHGTESEPKPLVVDVARLDAAAYARKPGNVDPWVHHYVTTTYGIDVMTLPEAAERAPDFVRLQIDEAVATIQRALIEGLVAGVDVRGVPDE